MFSISSSLFSGYWGKPEATSEAFRDGWVSVGDLAVRDDEGYLYIVDRKKDMVISGGVNIYPREVEAVLDMHPAIAESAIFGVPDAQWGERLVGCVVLRPDAVFAVDEVLGYLKPLLAPYKLPKQLWPIAMLPRNANGKVLKRELRETFK